jgi:exopolyphosphatase/guanosine-5'-triphosphate,3'-diphosphate pyrophosphatase
VIPYPIEIISGNEEARLIFMGVEHTQPERPQAGHDIGGGSTELVIGEDLSLVWWKAAVWAASASRSLLSWRRHQQENFQRARLSAVQKLETLAWQFRIQGWNVALGASGTIKAAHEVLVAMGEKDGFITPERLEMLVEEC